MKTCARRFAIFSTILCGFISAACGGTRGLILSDSELEDAQNEGDSSSSDSDSGSSESDASDVTTDTITTETTGDSDNTPVATEVEAENITLNCTNRTTDSPDGDYITVTCGDGDGAEVKIYYCDSEIVTDQQDDGALFTVMTVTCTVEEDGTGTIEEEETIVG